MSRTVFMVIATKGDGDVDCGCFRTIEEATAQAKDMNEDELARSEGWTYRVEERQI